MAINEPVVNYTIEQYLSFILSKFAGSTDVPVPYDVLKNISDRISTNETDISTNTSDISTNATAIATKADESEIAIGIKDSSELGQLVSIDGDTSLGTVTFTFSDGTIAIGDVAVS